MQRLVARWQKLPRIDLVRKVAWRHVHRDTHFRLMDYALLHGYINEAETLANLHVIYQSMEKVGTFPKGTVWVRPASEFFDRSRFEAVVYFDKFDDKKKD